ncbi:uncharacterized protein [Chironomus tepperi]|uniref:uncharacterized protein n=1 Tax=Chironomus tepperi TaxID=113505 RepID=UPI00391EF753
MTDLEYISVEYAENEQDFSRNWNSSSNFIEITNIPSAQCGLKLISQEWFKSKLCENEAITGINLRINEAINENFKEQPHLFEFEFRDYFLISFQSSSGDCESMTYWKVPDRTTFYSTFIDCNKEVDVVRFFHKFLLEQFDDECSGVMYGFEDRNEIRLHEIGSDLESNLLMIAASWGNLDVVQKLTTWEFDVDYKNDEDEMAIDYAWSKFIASKDKQQEKYSSIMLCLLNANSVYPKNFDYLKASKEIQDFVDMCEALHHDVMMNDFDSLTEKLEAYPNLMFFYDRKNKSLLLHALEELKFKIIDYLDNGINAGEHEQMTFMEAYERTFRKDLQKKHKLNATELPKTYLMILRSKTKIGRNDQLSHMRRRYVEETYDILDKNPFCSLILQVVAQIKEIKIFFDFKHETVHYLDPMKSSAVLGTAYPSGTIYIGAKMLGTGTDKTEVPSVLAHELCHIAVNVSYMNPKFDPYPLGESDTKKEYLNDVMAQSRELMEEENIVTNAFEYKEDIQASELIVTVAQMLIFYHEEPDRIAELQSIFKKLFKYAYEVVEPEFERALPVLRKLGDEEVNIRFSSLTKSIKQSFSHLPIVLQGVKTKFYDLFGYDDSCLEHLTADQIRGFLLKGKSIEIGKMCESELKYKLIQRNFIDRETYEKLKSSDIQKYTTSVHVKSKPIMNIRETAEQSKSFILADYAGTGKTTVFRESAIEIKQKDETFWVSYINLRKFELIFKNYEGNLKTLSFSDVKEILLQILKIDQNKFEKHVFLTLLARNQVVLLFDGVDEICPMHTNIIMKTFKILKESAGSNEFWISTRPHYAPKIKDIFGVRPITFVLYTAEQKCEFIKDILTKNDVTDETEQENAIGQINSFIFHLNWEPGYFSDPDHPLIIEIISEIYAKKREISLDASSYYGLYYEMINKQKEKLGDRIPNVERDPYSPLTVWQAHQVLAILVIIGELYDNTFTYVKPDGTVHKEGFNFKLEDLAIIQKWRAERRSSRSDWTSDMIQRYGFVTVNLNNKEEDRSCIDFSHKTYAEFFVAQYLIDFLFNIDIKDDEMLKMMRILEIVQGTQGLENVAKFIFSYMKTVAAVEKRKLHAGVEEVIKVKIGRAVADLDKEPLKDARDSFIFYGKLIVFNDDLVSMLWGLNEEQTSLEKIIRSGHLYNLNMTLDTANFILGDDWHERLNRSAVKLIPHKDIEAMRDTIVESWQDWKNDKNMLKFCDYLHKNYDLNINRQIHDKEVYIFHISNNKVRIEIIRLMTDIYDRNAFIDKCLKNIYLMNLSAECLDFILSQTEKLFVNDRGLIRHLLFVDLRGESSLFYNAVLSRNTKVLPIIKQYYSKYQDSIDEVQEMLMEVNTSDIFKSAIEAELPIYQEYKEFIHDLFKDNMEVFKEKVMDFLVCEFEAVDEKSYENIKDFIYFLFDETTADDLLEYVSIKEESVDYSYAAYESNNWSGDDGDGDDSDNNSYIGDNPTDCIIKKIHHLAHSKSEGATEALNSIFEVFYPVNDDEGGRKDGESKEAERREAGTSDAERREAGTSDAERREAGTSEAESREAGTNEAGTSEAESREAGTSEAEMKEAGKKE